MDSRTLSGTDLQSAYFSLLHIHHYLTPDGDVDSHTIHHRTHGFQDWFRGRPDSSGLYFILERIGVEPSPTEFLSVASTELASVPKTGRVGLEPTTHRLTGGCSNQVSYQPLSYVGRDLHIYHII